MVVDKQVGSPPPGQTRSETGRHHVARLQAVLRQVHADEFFPVRREGVISLDAGSRVRLRVPSDAPKELRLHEE